MPFIPWDERMSLGVEEIDAQHKHLLTLVNELHECCSLSSDPAIVRRVADAFTLYTRDHFATEERYMDSLGYPEYERHLKEHMDCSLKALEFFGASLDEDNPDLARDMLAYLKDWLLTHLLRTDRKLGEFLRGEGMK